MKKRCYNPKSNGYDNYGGRGITVCKRWLIPKVGFWNFLQDMGPRPSKKHSLDRIKTNRNYTPKNCKWSSGEEQGSNKRNNVYVVYEGRKITISQLARIVKMDNTVLTHRIQRGKMTMEEAISRPLGIKPNKKRVRHVPTGVEYSSIREAAISNGILYSVLKNRIRLKCQSNEFEYI
jgi:hypothetical protein